jgi:HAD superfamily hydrolase (TIGR01549 family)
MYDCVIFDVDGTLIDTEKAVLFSLKKALKEETAIEYSLEDLSFAMGIPGAESLRRLGVGNVDAMNDQWNKYMKDYYHLISVFTDIEFVLEELHKMGIKAGIVTSKTGQELNDDLGPFHLLKYLPYTVCADDTIKHKPDPEPILKFGEIANIELKRAIYIGDTIYDLQAAQGAGVDFGLALWGAGGKELPGSKYQFASPREIIEAVNMKI